MAVPALGQLPRTYQAQRVDSPEPAIAGNFGLGIVRVGDLNADGEDDFVMPQTANSPNGDGQVYVFSGETGALIDTVNAPDPGGAGVKASFGDPWVSRMEDIGSCSGGTSGATCPQNPLGAPDGVPEILVGATGVDVPTAGVPGGTAVDIGRSYVIDGATRAVLKRIDMPPEDRAEQANLGVPADQKRPGFGRVVASPSGLPPCENNAGVRACPNLAAVPAAVREGDLDGNGEPDIVVGASTYFETAATAHPDSQCNDSAATACRGAGRSYIFSGEQIRQSNPNVPLDGTGAGQTPPSKLRNIHAQADDPDTTVNTNTELFGHLVFPVGDVGKCNATPGPGNRCAPGDSTSTPDGQPDVLISAFRVDTPVDDPDPAFFDVGVNFLIDGETGSVLYTYQHPEPQAASIFGFTLHNEPAAGDLGSSALPDVYLPAMRQNAQGRTAAGRGYIMNGFFKTGANSINFAQLNDPTPRVGGNFGVSSSGVGDLVPDSASPRNELLIGAFGPHNPGTDLSVINDVHFFNALRERVLQTIPDPDQQEGSSFGTAVAPLGDLNEDGFLDFVVGADLFDAATGADQGRVYVFRSDNSPGPTPSPQPTPPGATPGPPGPQGPSGAVRTLAGRVVEVEASRTRTRRARRVRLRGFVEAFANSAGCERRQLVLLQQRRRGQLRYRTFRRVRTGSRGTFGRFIRPRRTAFYRALVRRTSECQGAASGREQVAVVRSRRR